MNLDLRLAVSSLLVWSVVVLSGIMRFACGVVKALTSFDVSENGGHSSSEDEAHNVIE
jgi:hypothetical protein